MRTGDLAKETDILLHDAQYTADEYKARAGWGHSSMEDALTFAGLTGVKRLILSHHDPMHSDAQLDELYAQLVHSSSLPFPFEMAVEGTRIEL